MGTNSVHLDGLVESCRFVGDAGGRSVAKLTVVTLHPRESSPSSRPSDSFEKITHVVRVLADQKLAKELQSLIRDLRTERAANEPELAVLYPCSLDGSLRTLDGDTFVDVVGKNFTLTQQVSTSAGNNIANLEGRVASCSFTDTSARLNVNTKQGVVSVFFSKVANPSGWESVSAGSVRKGDRVSLSGPLVDRVFTDGKKTQREYYLSSQVLQKLSLEKKRTSGLNL